MRSRLALILAIAFVGFVVALAFGFALVLNAR
jgi:hypothetical protein